MKSVYAVAAILFMSAGMVLYQAQSADNEMMKSDHMTAQDSNQSAPSMSPQQMKAHMRMMNKMMTQQLQPADENYDQRFLDMMILHHQGGVAMAKDAVEKAKHPEVKEAAQKIIDSQEKEIAQMREWRTKWYGEDKDAAEKDQNSDESMKHKQE